MSTSFQGFTRGALTFLRQLKRNNRRQWFHENKAAYEEAVLVPMRLLVEEMDVRFASFAPEIGGDPKRSIFRIYRDVRFSKDKSPYKTHAASWFSHRNASHGVGSRRTAGVRALLPFGPAPRWSPAGSGCRRLTLNRLRDAVVARPGVRRR